MRAIRTGCLCLGAAAVLACAIGATSASALPAFFECHKGAVGSGIYEDKKCSTLAKPGKGTYELQEGIGKGKAFKGKGGKLTYHIPADGLEITCLSSSDEGTINSPTTMNEVVITLRRCEWAKKLCTSAGELGGTIVTHNLAGTLDYIDKAEKEVGVALTAETGTVFAEFNCEGLEFVMTGSWIGYVTPANVFTRTLDWTFRVNGEGFQEVNQFEGGPREVLLTRVNGTGPFETGIQEEIANKGEELKLEA